MVNENAYLLHGEDDGIIYPVTYENLVFTKDGQKTIDQVYGKKLFVHNITTTVSTSSGTWNYQFSIINNVSDNYTQIGQIAHYFFVKEKVGCRISATGIYTESNTKYIITGFRVDQDSMVVFEMYKLTDGTYKEISTGAVVVTDYKIALD